MNSRIFTVVIAVALALAAFAGCQGNKPQEQATTPQEQPAKPAEQPETTPPPAAPPAVPPSPSPFSPPPPPEEMPPVVTPDKPVEMPPLEVKPVQPNDPAADAVKAAFDKMKLGNSPAFGLLYRDWVMALYTRDFDKAWGMYTANTQDKVEQQAASEIYGLTLNIKMDENSLQNPNLAPKTKEELQNRVALLSDRLGKVRMMPNRKYHAYVFQETERRTGKNPAEPFLTEGMEVIGESIKGDRACIATNLPAPNDRLFFTRENGAWKIDFLRIPRVPLDSAPAAEQPNKP